MKRKYGTDSLHYKDAQAYDEHAKTVDDLRKARKKYGIDSPEYKQAAAREKEAYEKEGFISCSSYGHDFTFGFR